MTRCTGALAFVTLLLAVALTGCVTSPRPDDPSTRITLPPTGPFDYQLGGGYSPAKDVVVVTRDSSDEPMADVYSICYVNGFQTQPGAPWPPTLILHGSDDEPVVDPGWPDEHLIDISTAAKRSAAASRQRETIRECARKGFDAVEFDNFDSWTRSHGALTKADAVAFAKLLVGAAHAQGLAASQKNAADLAQIGKQDIGFDFATAEECDRFSECDRYTNVYGAHVFDIEYTDDLRGDFRSVCARPSTPRQTVLRDRELLTPSDQGYAYQHC